jgi:hypothetical protein
MKVPGSVRLQPDRDSANALPIKSFRAESFQVAGIPGDHAGDEAKNRAWSA